MVQDPLWLQQQVQTFGDISMGDGNNFTVTQIIQISVATIQTRPLIEASPYKGLKKFNSKDKDYFFGREQLIARLVEAVKKSNLILLLGASGSGKSSVVRAGLIPLFSKLLGAKFCDFPLNPDRDPFESLRISLVSQGYKQEQAEIALKGESTTLTKVIESLKESNSQWLIFIDQFEELFTICQDLKQRENFIEGIVKIANSQDKSVKIVIAMRADFLDKLSPYHNFGEIAQKNIHLITDMHADELRLAIEQPAARNGVIFEQGLVEEMIKDVQGQPGYLPLLQYTLDLLWENDDIANRTLNVKTYRELGGVRGALQNHVDKIYNNLTEQEKAETKKIFIRLVDIVGSFEKANLVGRSVSRRAYLSDFPNDGLLRITLQKLIDNNLIVSNREQQTTVKEKATVEIAHEILISSWQTLKNWIEESKEVIIIRNRLADDAKRWNNLLITNNTKAKDELWSGSKLDRVLDLQKDKPFELELGGLNEEQNKFIIESVDLRERLRKQERQQQKLKIGFFVAFIATLILVLIVWNQYNETQLNKVLALAADGFPKPELLPAAKVLLNKASNLHNSAKNDNEVEEALTNYRAVINLTNLLEENRNQVSVNYKLLKEISDKAEKKLVELIHEKRLNHLQTQLENNLIGNKISNIQEKYSENYTEGALKTTYLILYSKYGVKSDINGDGELTTDQETKRMPCDLLKEIDNVWKINTKCTWFKYCKAIPNERNLIQNIFYFPKQPAIDRLKNCGINSE